MNEFLDNLAQRAMNNEQGVEPRLPSLFAPAAPVTIWPPMTVASESEPFEAAVDRETDVTAPIKSPRPTRLNRLEEMDRETNVATPMNSLRSTQPSWLEEEEQPKGSPSPALIRHRSLLSVLQDAQPDSPSFVVNNRARNGSQVEDPVRQRPLSPSMAAPAPNPPRLADRRDVRVEDRGVRQVVNGAVIQPAMIKTSGGREIEVRLSQASSLIMPPAQDYPRPETKIPGIKADASEAATTENQGSFIVRPRLDQYSEPPASWAKTQAQPAAATTEQVINVTIGRVEVRATPAPAAATRSSNQKPPMMSLEDYLRRRSGGGGGSV